jgi:MFS family permease
VTSLLGRAFPALTVAPFRTLWLGTIPSLLALQISVMTAGYAAVTLSRSAVDLGLVTSAWGIPLLVVPLLGGVAADRFSRGSIVMLSQVVLGVAAVTMAVIALSGRLAIAHLVVLGLVQGTALGFNVPARLALVSDLVPSELLPNAVAAQNAGGSIARVAGPALAGTLLSLPWLGIGPVFALSAVMYGIVAMTLFVVRDAYVSTREPERGGTWSRMVDGLAYVRANRILAVLMPLAIGTMLLGMPYVQLMPLFSEQVFQVGPSGLGILLAASGLGAVVGSVAVGAGAPGIRAQKAQLIFGIGFGLALIAFASAPTFPLAVLAVSCVGFASASFVTANGVLVSTSTAAPFYGRVMSIYLLTFSVALLGTLPLAWMSEHIGPRLTVALAGALVVGLVWLLSRPRAEEVVAT